MPRSAKARLTEHWNVHGTYLTITSVLEDPVVLTEPLVRSQTWFLDPGQRAGLFPCEDVPEVPAPPGTVPHHLPGTNPNLQEYVDWYGVPAEAARGGAETIYPGVPAEAGEDLQAQGQMRALLQLRRVWRLSVCDEPMTQMRFKPLIAAAIAVTGLAIGTTTSIAQGQPPGASTPPVGMLHVQRNVHMLVVDGMNIAVQVGDDGVLLVDAATAAVAPQVIAAIRTLSPKPIHTIINTHVHPDHTGGNESLVEQRGTGAPQAVRVIAHQTVHDRMIAAAPAGSSGGFRLNAVITLPINNTYDTPTKDFFLNGEPVVDLPRPAAHTDGDSLVHFRSSDVIAVGDVFTPDRYPIIDRATGGIVQGTDRRVEPHPRDHRAARFQEGGTYRDPRARTALRRSRRRRVSRHGHDHSRPCAGPDRQRTDMGTGEGGAAVA